jgi:hypothetical protein
MLLSLASVRASYLHHNHDARASILTQQLYRGPGVVCLYAQVRSRIFRGDVQVRGSATYFSRPTATILPFAIARDNVVLWEAVSYTRFARTIRRFSKVGIGVHVCNVTMSLPLTCPITHESVGSTTNTSLTRYL